MTTATRESNRRHPVTRIRVAIVAMLAFTAAALSSPINLAAAQTDDADERPDRPAHLVIEAQDTWVEPDQRFAARVAIIDPPANATLDVRMHPRVTGRIDFAATIRGNQLESPILQLDPIELRGARTRVVVIPRPDPGTPERTPGVYPVSITLTSDTGEPLDQIVTHVIQVGTATDDFHPLAVGVLFDLGSGTAPEAVTVDDHARAMTTIGTIVEDHPAVPVAVRLDPRRVADEDVPAELTRALSVSRLIPETFVEANPADWLAAGLESQLDEQRAFADRVMVDRVGRAPDTDIAVMAARPERQSRDWHRARGAVGLVTTEAALTPLDAEQFPVTVARPFVLSAGDDLAVITIDPALRSAFTAATAGVVSESDESETEEAATQPAELARRLDRPASAIEAAHRILAELAVIWSEQPARRRGVVLSPPPAQQLDDAVLAALFEQLDRAPTIVEPMDLGDLFTEVPRAEQGDGVVLTRSVAPGRIDPLDELATGLEASSTLLASYEGFVGEDAPRLQPLRRQRLDAGDPQLDASERRQLFETISATVTDDLGGVSLPDGQRITLTSRRAEVPLTIRKERSGPVTVRLSFASQKLDFPDGADRTIELVDDQTELSVPVEARASGEFPLEIIATSPDGQLEIASASLTVRSTAFSGVGLFLSGGALTFLVVWWTRNAVARRRATTDYGDGAVSLTSDPRDEP